MADKVSNAAAEEAKKKVVERKDIMEPDQILVCHGGGKYVIEKLRRKGRFGELYRAHVYNEPMRKYAVKMELISNTTGAARMKNEMLIFEEIQKSSSIVDKSRFVKFVQHGRSAEFTFYVMDLMWSTLDAVVGLTLTPSTLINIARQTLQGIEALHALGYMHRDISPACFGIGMYPRRDHLIYLVDFGDARSCKDPKLARARDSFVPHSRYASVAALEGQDPVRKDDVVAWMYMLLEIYDKKNLPWRNERDVQAILKAKQYQQKNWHEQIKTRTINAPLHFYSINCWIVKDCKPQSPVDFAHLFKELSATAQMDNIDDSLPPEWVKMKKRATPKATPKKDEKKKRKKGEAKKQKRSRASSKEDVVFTVAELLDMLEEAKRRRKKNHRQEEQGEEEAEEEDEDSDVEAIRRRKKKKSKSHEEESPGKKRNRRRVGKKRSREKESREGPIRRRTSRERESVEEATAEEIEDKQKEMPERPLFRKKPARREGTENSEEKEGKKGKSTETINDGKSVEVEMKTKDSAEHKDAEKEKKTVADEEAEPASVRGIEPAKEGDEEGGKKLRAAKQVNPESAKLSGEDVQPAKLSNEAIPDKKEAAVDKK